MKAKIIAVLAASLVLNSGCINQNGITETVKTNYISKGTEVKNMQLSGDSTSSQTGDTILNDAYNHLSNLKSYRMLRGIITDKKSSKNKNIKMSTTVNTDSKVILEPAILVEANTITDTIVNNIKNHMSLLQYIKQENGKTILYQKIMGNWNKIVTQQSGARLEQHPADDLKCFIDNKEKVEQVGEEIINNRTYNKIKVTLNKGSFDKIMQELKCTDKLQLGENSESIKAKAIANMGEFAMTCWFDKASGDFLKEEMDLSSFMYQILKLSGQAQYDTVTMKINIAYSDYDNINSIIIPDEALQG